jgi:hypothetical protein
LFAPVIDRDKQKVFSVRSTASVVNESLEVQRKA